MICRGIDNFSCCCLKDIFLKNKNVLPYVYVLHEYGLNQLCLGFVKIVVIIFDTPDNT